MNVKVYAEICIKNPIIIPKILIIKVRKRVYSYLNSKGLINYQKRYKMLDNDKIKLFWFSGLKKKSRNKDLVAERDIQLILEDARRIIEGKFDFLDIQVDINNIRWNRDYKTGYFWDKKPYNKLNIYKKPIDVDVKTVWELNRMHHLVRLAQAWVITGDAIYVQRIIRDVETWLDDNPVGFGVNWTNAMEVAIRASNIAVAYYLIKDSTYIDEKFSNKIYFLMESHGKYIYNNLEWFPGKNGNHYLTNLCGLIFISVLFPNIKDSRKWINFAINELIKEINIQILPDGSDFEASLSYHKLVLEMLMFTFALLKSNNYFIPDFIENKIKKMIRFTEGYIKWNGMAPQIGDNDSGHFLMLFPRHNLDHSYLLDIASTLFDDFTAFQNTSRLKEVFWINPNKEVPYDKKINFKSVAFKDSGIYVMKGRNMYCAISCGPVGQRGNGGHSHNDKLSVEISIDNEDFIVDPGSYVYTSNVNWRNYFRSTAVHNTISINNSEQNDIIPEEIFRLRDQTKCKCTLWQSTDMYDNFSGYHIGYLEKFNIVHYRSIYHNKIKNELNFKDRIKTFGEKKWYYINFNLTLHPNVKIFYLSNDYVYLINNNVIVKITFRSPTYINIKTNDSWYSPKYGKKIPTKSLNFTIKNNKDCYIEWKVEKINNEIYK